MAGKRRVFVIRHGETEWSLTGQHTGSTDIPLAKVGEDLIVKHTKHFVGPGKLIDTNKLCRIIVSPLQRARRTLELLGIDPSVPVDVDADIAEWDYGDYEGLLTSEIRKLQPSGEWEIWKNGCTNGESPEQVCQRLDRIVAKCRSIQMDSVDKDVDGNILVVAHGHALRGLAARWIELPLPKGRAFMLDAGAIGELGYEHNTFDEPTCFRWNVPTLLYKE
ncbi:phosphoglycerate mutase [Schizosaccharomyces japonicus yFS275]|uniref:Phosphoglycerate mutase n=1 Tax=Schizosaccharomyces japonicus (strain yFS275 / FY16936) TaxID=402676 RepID=B6K2W0_SCHJY|nr:phosphoglycerate mutase [Schizosaccharomyces japonicus yFS275]EEB08600.2 phosphoglycerate mutase [Schizosaccharomyces japonicus yFS275]